MRVIVIANPAAGRAEDSAPIDEARSRLAAAGHVVDVVETAGSGDGERLAAQAARAEADLVVAAGGDGTLNEVINGLASVEGALQRCVAGILPIGTGNDFARMLGIEAGESAADALVAGRTRAVDLLRLNDRVFLNASAGGFTAETSSQVTPGLKQAVGTLAYLIGGARALLEYEPVHAVVDSGERRLDMDLQLFAVCNGAYIGGGHQLAPRARIDDGLFDVCLVRASSTIDFLTLLPRLSSGDHLDDEDVVYFRATELAMRFARPIKVNTDGEVLDLARCRYAIDPGAVRFAVPVDTRT